MNARSISAFPQMLRHEGIWEGTYQHIDLDGKLLDVHKSRVECIFPKSGEIAYIQKNKFEWEDGRTYQVEFGGVIKNDKIFWDTETFVGNGWESETCVLLELDRKDDPGASFTEIIILANDGKSRARTWHWFKNGKCFKRTLCNETKVTS